MSSSYSRNKYRCLLKPHNQNVIVSHDNNIQNPIPNSHYPCIYPDGPYYPGYPCIGPYPYAQKMQQEDQNQPSIPKPTPPIPKPTPQPRLYPYGPYPGIGPYYPGIGPYYPGYPGGPYYGGPYPGYPNGPYPYSQQIKEKVKPKNENVENKHIGENIGNMEPHCEYYSSSSSSSSSSDSDRYRRRYRRYAKVSGEKDTQVPEKDTQVFDLEKVFTEKVFTEKEFTEKDSNRVFDEQNQKPYPKPRPRPKPDPSFNPTPNLIEEMHETNKKSFAKPLANLFTKFTTPEKEPEVNELIQVVEDENKEKNEKNEKKEKNLIFLKV